MKIITKGNPWWVGVRARCKACDCVIELELRDKPSIFDTEHPDVVFCPQCREMIDVKIPLESSKVWDCGTASA